MDPRSAVQLCQICGASSHVDTLVDADQPEPLTGLTRALEIRVPVRRQQS